jgi:hypothetical protein
MAWSSLSGAISAPGWQAIDLVPAGPIEVRAGRRAPDNSEAVLVGFKSAKLGVAEKLPEGQGFSVERADPEGNGCLWLALTRKSAGPDELFTSMACDVIGALDVAAAAGVHEAKLLRLFVSRVGAWQEFMRKGTHTLSPEAEIGLVGELHCLLAVLEAGAPAAATLHAWVGPLDGLQDFFLGTGALEVKTTLAAAGFPAMISSLEQLDDAKRHPLFVARVRLRQTAGGKTLPQIAADVTETVAGDAEATRLFTERLLAAGYTDLHADRYPRRFEHADTRVVEVHADFPRLTTGNVPAGIVRAMYEVDLDKAPGYDIGIGGALKKLGVV